MAHTHPLRCRHHDLPRCRCARRWDYETCTFLIEQIGTNNETDMFPPREWTFEWLDAHCAARSGSGSGRSCVSCGACWLLLAVSTEREEAGCLLGDPRKTFTKCAARHMG